VRAVSFQFTFYFYKVNIGCWSIILNSISSRSLVLLLLVSSIWMPACQSYRWIWLNLTVGLWRWVRLLLISLFELFKIRLVTILFWNLITIHLKNGCQLHADVLMLLAILLQWDDALCFTSTTLSWLTCSTCSISCAACWQSRPIQRNAWLSLSMFTTYLTLHLFHIRATRAIPFLIHFANVSIVIILGSPLISLRWIMTNSWLNSPIVFTNIF
jgi:hypothetical protein